MTEILVPEFSIQDSQANLHLPKYMLMYVEQ